MSYKRWIFTAVFIFVIGFGGGLTLAQPDPASTSNLLAEDIAALEELFDTLATLPQESVFMFIFFKNVSAILISFVLSPIFCLVPAMALFINGGLLGSISALVVQEQSLGFLLAGLLPHGVIELPAFIMGEAVALSFGTSVMLALFRRKREGPLLPHLKQNLRYLVVVIILLLPAALIETYLTPLLLR
ncbi:stage II sporulation protein M [Chloroflexota bacterium]